MQQIPWSGAWYVWQRKARNTAAPGTIADGVRKFLAMPSQRSDPEIDIDHFVRTRRLAYAAIIIHGHLCHHAFIYTPALASQPTFFPIASRLLHQRILLRKLRRNRFNYGPKFSVTRFNLALGLAKIKDDPALRTTKPLVFFPISHCFPNSTLLFDSTNLQSHTRQHGHRCTHTTSCSILRSPRLVSTPPICLIRCLIIVLFSTPQMAIKC